MNDLEFKREGRNLIDDLNECNVSTRELIIDEYHEKSLPHETELNHSLSKQTETIQTNATNSNNENNNELMIINQKQLILERACIPVLSRSSFYGPESPEPESLVNELNENQSIDSPDLTHSNEKNTTTIEKNIPQQNELDNELMPTTSKAIEENENSRQDTVEETTTEGVEKQKEEEEEEKKINKSMALPTTKKSGLKRKINQSLPIDRQGPITRSRSKALKQFETAANQPTTSKASLKMSANENESESESENENENPRKKSSSKLNNQSTNASSNSTTESAGSKTRGRKKVAASNAAAEVSINSQASSIVSNMSAETSIASRRKRQKRTTSVEPVQNNYYLRSKSKNNQQPK